MRIVAVAIALVVTLASSASSQQGPQSINNNPREAYFLSAASVAAHRAKLMEVAYANITVVERPEATSSSGVA